MRCGLAMVHHKGFGGDRSTNILSNLLGKAEIDLSQTQCHTLVNDGVIAVVQLKAEGLGHVELLVFRHGVIEQLGLLVVLAELVAQSTLLEALVLLRVRDKSAVLRLRWRDSLETVWPVVHRASGDLVTHSAIAVVVQDGADRSVDWELFPVGAQTGDLSIKIGEVTALEQRVVGEFDTGDDVAGAESNLLSLGEEFVHVPVQLHLSNNADGELILGPEFGGIQRVEFELVLVLLGNHLDSKVPLGVCLVVDGLHEVLAVEVRVLSSQLQSLIPDQRVNTKVRDPVELDKMALALLVDQAECVDTKSLHHTVRSWDSTVRHGPVEHVRGLRVKKDEVPEVVVS